MIKIKDVITIRIPFPNISSDLALMSHMYTCISAGDDKELLKCQTFKPLHLLEEYQPYNYVVEDPDNSRNPFVKKTTIDCDKSFIVENVTIDKTLRARRDICDKLYNNICSKIVHLDFTSHKLPIDDVLRLNWKIVRNQTA